MKWKRLKSFWIYLIRGSPQAATGVDKTKVLEITNVSDLDGTVVLDETSSGNEQQTTDIISLSDEQSNLDIHQLKNSIDHNV